MEPVHVEPVFEGSLLRVEVERWTDPERVREVVRHPGAAAVVPLTDDGRVVLIRQLREPLRRRLLEIPAGIFDAAGERAEDTARRELEEETGWRARSLEPLGTIHTSAGFSDEAIRLFRADVGDRAAGAPEAGIEVVTMPIAEAVGAVRGGAITDAKTIVGLLLVHADGARSGAG